MADEVLSSYARERERERERETFLTRSNKVIIRNGFGGVHYGE
jgi:hypothetical protein